MISHSAIYLDQLVQFKAVLKITLESRYILGV
jgi:hypothetical protein